MRDINECLAKASEMESEAEICPDEFVATYLRLAADWKLLAHYATWRLRFLAASAPPLV
jgi:hypothetical protein